VGSTTLIDELIDKEFSNLIATDISEVALNNLEARIGKGNVEIVVDDVINPSLLNNIKPVDLWIDRAVLHFFTEIKDQDTYFSLLKGTVKKNGYVLLAQFNLNGAQKCSGLPIHRYSAKMLADKLGKDFKMIEGFDYTYTMPSGDLRPYVYALFRKV
jgi:methyltransferase family protein